MRLTDELIRKSIHVSFLIVPLAYFYGVPKHIVRDFLLVGTVVSIGFEILRLHEPRVRSFFRQFFGGLTRRHEKRALLGSTYLMIASLVSVELFSVEICTAALGALVLGDTAAALVGKKWGRIHPFGSRKSLEGSVALLVVSFLFSLFVVHLSWEVALLGAVVAAVFEFLPIPLDDNFAIPLSSGFAMKLIS